MLFSLPLLPFFVVIFTLLLLSYWLGTNIKAGKKDNGLLNNKSTFFIEGTLLSMLLGFTFSLAAGKYDKRRSTLNEEVNSISTVLLRTHLYPDSITTELNGYMSGYLDTRIDYYDAGNDTSKIRLAINKGDSISKLIFKSVSIHAKDPANLAYTQQIVPALGNMFDSITTREIYRKSKVPLSVLRLLLILSIVVSFLNGFNQEKRGISWVQAIGYSLLVSLTFVLIMDMNDNRNGSIDLSNEESLFINLRNGLNGYRNL